MNSYRPAGYEALIDSMKRQKNEHHNKTSKLEIQRLVWGKADF
jgi:hypothetical protein